MRRKVWIGYWKISGLVDKDKAKVRNMHELMKETVVYAELGAVGTGAFGSIVERCEDLGKEAESLS